MSDITTAQPPAQIGTSMLTVLERILKDPQFDIQKAEAVMRLVAEQEQRMLERDARDAKRAYSRDWSAVQNEIERVRQSGRNPAIGNPYAKLADLDKALREVATRHGFAYRFTFAEPPQPGWIRMGMIVSHDQGHEEQHWFDGPIDNASSGRVQRTPIQSVGSTTTYLRRYLMMTVWNLVPSNDPSDDDGEASRRPSGNGRERYVARTTNYPDNDPPPAWGAPEPASEPPAVTTKPNGSGNGSGQVPNLRQQLDAFEADAKAVQTAEQWDALMATEFVRKCEEKLATTSAAAWDRFNRIRDAERARLFPSEEVI